MRTGTVIGLAAMMVGLACLGCNPEGLTVGQTLQALDEAAKAEQALTFASGTVEISTHFTIGDAVEAAAAELRAFIESQLPCAEVTIAGAKLTVVYGAHAGNCTFHGQTYSGSHSIEITSATAGNVVVEHEWTELANAKLSVSGSATVTWSAAEASRNVVHELTWTNLQNDEEVTGSGDRTQTALAGGIVEGIEVAGSRHWTSPRGEWDLNILDVEMRWIDPVPQSGAYELLTPFDGKSAVMTFTRVDEDTIEVEITSGRRSFTFIVNKLGEVTEE